MTRLPPQNLEAEQSVMGGVMIDPNALDRVIDIISENDFYKAANRKIYNAVLGLRQRNQPVDLLTVTSALRDEGILDAVGGTSYLATVIDQTPSSANIMSYAEIVKEKSTLRKLLESCNSIIEKTYEQSYSDLDAFLNEAESSIFSIAEKAKGMGLTHAGLIIKSSLDRIEYLYNQKSSMTGVASGITDLDKMTSGFQPGELIIIAARPSMGKTALCLNIAQHIALREKKSVAFFSLEMSQDQVMMRMLGSEARVNLSDLRVGRVSDSVWPKLISVASKFSEAPLYIDDTSGSSPYEIRAKCRRLKAQKGLDIVIVDYLQIMDLKTKVESRERAISEISRNMKALAKELKIPVIVLSQINRGVEGRTDRRPMLSDLRESGSIEQDADVVAMIYRDEYYDRENSEIKGQAELIIGKQRNGPTGAVKMAWLSQYGTFANLQPTAEAPGPTTHTFPNA
ncbi:MAG: replicative DNA helicase [Oligoflexia bacterium]|nr:replicative DNA helicase [Oligoflexia bacterium]